MKATTSMQNSLFFHAGLPTTAPWGGTRQRISRKPQALPALPLDVDALASSSKQEVVCAVILALCFLYTLVLAASQLVA